MVLNLAFRRKGIHQQKKNENFMTVVKHDTKIMIIEKREGVLGVLREIIKVRNKIEVEELVKSVNEDSVKQGRYKSVSSGNGSI